MAGFLNVSELDDFSGVLVDCRFSLNDAADGHREYVLGHIPTARYLHLAEDMSAELGLHGGRHPLPSPQSFAARLGALGIASDTDVVIYDDSRFVFAARCWWMMRALGYREPRILNGGYAGWLAQGGAPETSAPRVTPLSPAAVPDAWPGCCDRAQLAQLQGQSAVLVDAREGPRYRGEHEPIDPIAGHIPGAINIPWQSFSDDLGMFLDADALRRCWGQTLEASPLVLYCGSGVSACVNLLALAMLGRDDAILYGGSWSDWCSYL